MTRNHTCHCCGQQTDRAMSTAPVVALLRILELCWRERHALPADLCERIREQLQGPAGDRAPADARVLDGVAERRTFEVRGVTLTTCTLEALEVLKAADAIPDRTLRNVNALSDFADLAKAEIARRKAAGEYDG